MTQAVLADELRPPAGPGALCSWCQGEIPERTESGRRTRADARTCATACRQASWRFGYIGPDWQADQARPRVFAYADPPYPGMAGIYRDHPDYAGEVDHAELIAHLLRGFPDGWALSTSSRTLRQVLELLPADVDVHIGAWTKPHPPRAGYHGRRSWEPVLFYGGRPRPLDAPMLLDWIHAAPPRALPGQVVGTKPSAFSVWLFNMLGAQACDELHDLYPGSGAVGRAWARFTGREAATTKEDVSCPEPTTAG